MLISWRRKWWMLVWSRGQIEGGLKTVGKQVNDGGVGDPRKGSAKER
jgi:hypothetical protein